MIGIIRIRNRDTGESCDIYKDGGNGFVTHNGVHTVYYADEITGFGPVKLRTNLSKIGLLPGKIINSTTLDERNISIHLASLDTSTKLSADKNNMLTTVFVIGNTVQVTFYCSEGAYCTYGVVDEVEADWMTVDPNSGISINILCPDPMFKLNTTYKIYSNLISEYSWFRTPTLPSEGSGVSLYDIAFTECVIPMMHRLTLSNGSKKLQFTLNHISLDKARYSVTDIFLDQKSKKATCAVDKLGEYSKLPMDVVTIPNSLAWDILYSPTTSNRLDYTFDAVKYSRVDNKIKPYSTPFTVPSYKVPGKPDREFDKIVISGLNEDYNDIESCTFENRSGYRISLYLNDQSEQLTLTKIVIDPSVPKAETYVNYPDGRSGTIPMAINETTDFSWLIPSASTKVLDFTLDKIKRQKLTYSELAGAPAFFTVPRIPLDGRSVIFRNIFMSFKPIANVKSVTFRVMIDSEYTDITLRIPRYSGQSVRDTMTNILISPKNRTASATINGPDSGEVSIYLDTSSVNPLDWNKLIPTDKNGNDVAVRIEVPNGLAMVDGIMFYRFDGKFPIDERPDIVGDDPTLSYLFVEYEEANIFGNEAQIRYRFSGNFPEKTVNGVI